MVQYYKESLRSYKKFALIKSLRDLNSKTSKTLINEINVTNSYKEDHLSDFFIFNICGALYLNTHKTYNTNRKQTES